MFKSVFLMIITTIICGCGVYTFSGSTLPSYLKTVDIPLFINQSLQPGVAEKLTDDLSKEILSSNLLKPVSQNSDATIFGKVLSYNNHPYTYGTQSRRNVNVSTYAVTISVEIDFYDNKKDKSLYKGRIQEDGIYDFNNQNEQNGKEIAIKKIIEKIMQNSVQSW